MSALISGTDVFPVRSMRLTGSILLLGAILWWGSATYPADMPGFLPWDFSWIEYLCISLPLAWYVRGLASAAPGERPHIMRRVAFFIGVALIYAVTQTEFVYLSQHMFFINRLQQLGMHHLGPVLIALGWPGETIARGMPEWALRITRAPWLQAILRVLQQPVIAGGIFVGLLWLWLLPEVHLPVMISPALYEVMNLSMVIDGLLFWFLILDPRPSPPASHSYAIRLITVIVICFPEMLIGAGLSFTDQSIYPYYDLCGRLFPSIGAVMDQHLGGIVVWIPGSLISSAAFMVVMNHIRLQDDKKAAGKHNDDIQIASGARFSSSSWTGR